MASKQVVAAARAPALARARAAKSDMPKGAKPVTVASVSGALHKRAPTLYQKFRSQRLRQLTEEGRKDPRQRRETISRQWKEAKDVRVTHAPVA